VSTSVSPDLRRIWRGARVPLVLLVLTNFDLPEYRAQAHALGVSYFLDKANEFDRLPAILEEIAARRWEDDAHTRLDA